MVRATIVVSLTILRGGCSQDTFFPDMIRDSGDTTTKSWNTQKDTARHMHTLTHKISIKQKNKKTK